MKHQKLGQSTGFVTASIEFVLRAALRDPVDEDFVHSITGKIIAETQETAEQEAGHLEAMLVQFDDALEAHANSWPHRKTRSRVSRRMRHL
jgi:hypothetical protein